MSQAVPESAFIFASVEVYEDALDNLVFMPFSVEFLATKRVRLMIDQLPAALSDSVLELPRVCVPGCVCLQVRVGAGSSSFHYVFVHYRHVHISVVIFELMHDLIESVIIS